MNEIHALLTDVASRVSADPDERGLSPEEAELWRKRAQRNADLDRAAAAEKARAHHQAVRKAIAALDLPERLLDLLRSPQLRGTDATDAADSGRTLTVLAGRPGCGKSVAAAKWLYDHAREHARAGVWLTAPRLARIGRYDEATMDRVFRAPRLVLDDLGTEYLDDGGSFLTTLDEMVNERFAAKRPTLITTNLTLDGFKTRYLERVVDRIREDGRFYVVAAPSMRASG